MEARGGLTDRPQTKFPDLCKAMNQGLSDLVRQMSPSITSRDVTELPLLTVGAQFQGSNNNAIGRQAIVDVFLSVREIVKNQIIKREERKLTVRNSSGRAV